MEQWLDSGIAKNTRRMYRRGVELFCAWYNKDVDTLLNERKDDCTPRPNENPVDFKNRESHFEKRALEKKGGREPLIILIIGNYR